jgi:hypothetical protein
MNTIRKRAESLRSYKAVGDTKTTQYDVPSACLKGAVEKKNTILHLLFLKFIINNITLLFTNKI